MEIYSFYKYLSPYHAPVSLINTAHTQKQTRTVRLQLHDSEGHISRETGNAAGHEHDLGSPAAPGVHQGGLPEG